MRNRVAKYLIPVFVFSVVFNVPKFFESEIEYQNVELTTTTNSSSMATTTAYSDNNNDSFSTLFENDFNVSFITIDLIRISLKGGGTIHQPRPGRLGGGV